METTSPDRAPARRRVREIHVRGIRSRRFLGYRVTVAPTSGLPPQTQFVKLPPAGPASVLFIYPMKALRAWIVEAGTLRRSAGCPVRIAQASPALACRSGPECRPGCAPR